MRLRKRCAPFFINHGYTIVETQEIEFVISHFFILLSIFLYYVFSIYSLWEANGTVLTLFINFFAVAKVNLSLYIHLKKRLNYMLGLYRLLFISQMKALLLPLNIQTSYQTQPTFTR